MPTEKCRTPACDRLLEAAGSVFARLGYEAATVTQICADAGANIAAINYHFGDKLSLYRLAVSVAIDRVKEGGGEEPPLQLSESTTLEQALGKMVRKTLAQILQVKPENWHFPLVLREFLTPVLPPGDPAVQRMNLLSPAGPWAALVARATGYAEEDPRLQWAVYCMHAPMLLLCSHPAAMARHFPALELGELDLEAFADHLARQVSCGLRGMEEKT